MPTALKPIHQERPGDCLLLEPQGALGGCPYDSDVFLSRGAEFPHDHRPGVRPHTDG
jgi:hypothetical protein